MVPESVLLELLVETEGHLADAELELKSLLERMGRLRAERYGLQLAMARRQEEGPAGNGRTAQAPAGAGPRLVPAGWSRLSRAEAVERVLRESAEPLTRLDIVQRLEATGRRGDDPDAVSAALAYLRREGRAGRMGRGRWTPAAADAATGRVGGISR